MLVNRIQGATRNLGKPSDWDDSKGNCVSLPIRDEVLSGGIPCMVSSWQPTPEEAERIAAGAPIWLRIVGVSHPPVSLEVSAPPSVSDGNPEGRGGNDD